MQPENREITSRDNPTYRYIRTLHDRKTAMSEGLVFIEGVRLCEDALISGMRPRYIVSSSERKALASLWCERFDVCQSASYYQFADPLFAKLGSTKNPQGIALVIEAPDYAKSIPSRGRDLYLILESVADPGNLGTIIRTADAFDFTAVILSGDSTDPYGEKAIRASMGSCFHIPIVSIPDISEVCMLLEQNGVQLIASDLRGDSLNSATIQLPCAVVIGNEARGITDTCANLCHYRVKIPMPGKAESLNASSAASVLAYEMMIRRDRTIHE